MKKVVYVIIGLVVLYFILALFGPKHMKVERQISINKPAPIVKQKLGDFKFFHDTWSPWSEKDPDMKTTYSGNPGEVGHKYTWSGNKDVGTGEMELTAFNGDTILQRLSFTGEGDSKAYYIVKDNGNSTNVTWGIAFDIGFLGRTPMLFMNMDKMLGGDFEKGLTNMKKIMEDMKDEPAVAHYDIDEQNWEEKNFVGTKRSKMAGEKCGAFFAENFPKMGAELGKSKVQPEMAPSAIFYSWDEKTMECECAAVMCLPKGKEMKGWEKYTIPASKVLHIAYYGSYDKSMNAHMAMGNYMKEKGLKENVVIEEYVTDPMNEKDTTKWLTNIYYVVK